MTSDLKPAWIVAAVVLGLAAVFLFLRTSEELQPELVTAHVGIRLGDDEMVRVAPVETTVGTAFRLYAIVEATDWRGRRLFYTDATALELGGELIEREQLRTWDRREKVRVLWFTVEGSPPYREVAEWSELDRSRYREVFQADWPQAWTVPGSLAPAVENFLPDHEERREPVRFGTQRFQVRVEIFAADSDLLPIQRLRSPGSGAVETGRDSFPRVSATLPRPLEALSRVYGLPQVEPVTEATREVIAGLAEQTRSGLLFSRGPLLREWLSSVGIEWEGLSWRAVELNGEAPWAFGAVVRAGSRLAFAYQDRGVVGRLDDSDLCLDFDRGATVRTMGEIFVGEGLVEVAAVD